MNDNSEEPLRLEAENMTTEKLQQMIVM